MKPLNGIRVLNATDEKGELCGRVLVDLGAQVIHLEQPGGGASRTLGPFAEAGGPSLFTRKLEAAFCFYGLPCRRFCVGVYAACGTG